MAKVVVTAEVEDTKKWEAGFRTHGDLFKSMTLTSMHYGITADNQIAVVGEPADLDKYMEVLNSQATADAMVSDGVRRETVKVFVVDREYRY